MFVLMGLVGKFVQFFPKYWYLVGKLDENLGLLRGKVGKIYVVTSAHSWHSAHILI